ncbi:NAD(P)-binding protein [Zopfia rhizophila CBS 207.26]|uniref:NAD(P)-binding protein n=1 Tax=Zopfia rhizophila CBS 207.26 TaxID=1314779 RepID=A0A6A6DQ91_9PEZI|nr:NAD(P)-binding protein [Zopfia rhizophila CBS 207.26]
MSLLSPSFLKSQYSNLPIPPASSFAGRTYIVTGANIGLGFECAKHLVGFSAKRVIIAVRSEARGAEAKAKIEAETGRKGIVEVWILDLGSFDSVKSFATRACNEIERIDGLIENASIALSDWTVTEGLETTLTVNVLGTFLLAMLLLPKMKADAKKSGVRSNPVIVGSNLGYMGNEGLLESIDGDMFNALNVKDRWPLGNARYGLSKLLQSYLARQLSTLLPVADTNVVINYLSPGLCKTGLTRHASLKMRIQVGAANALLGRTAEMGNRTLLHAVSAGPETHGNLLDDCKVKESVIPTWVTNADGRMTQERVWSQVTARLEKIEPGCVSKVVGT